MARDCTQGQKCYNCQSSLRFSSLGSATNLYD
jgi:hypothetical protein